DAAGLDAEFSDRRRIIYDRGRRLAVHRSGDAARGEAGIGGKKEGPKRLSPLRAINLATTYSRGTYRPTTIGCSGLNGRVRDGNGWNPRHVVTRKGIPAEPGKLYQVQGSPIYGGKINA